MTEHGVRLLQMLRAAVVFMSYGFCEEAVRRARGKAALRDLTVWDHASAGAMTGVVASFVLCPVEVIKCRLQALSTPLSNAKYIPGSVSFTSSCFLPLFQIGPGVNCSH